MSDKTVNHVSAYFGGEPRELSITPVMLAAIEFILKAGAYQTFVKFAHGHWTLHDLETVLTAALTTPPKSNASVRGVPIEMGTFACVLRMQSGKETKIIQDIFADNPPARYAPLAMKLLEAALFGISPENASFDERIRDEAA